LGPIILRSSSDSGPILIRTPRAESNIWIWSFCYGKCLLPLDLANCVPIGWHAKGLSQWICHWIVVSFKWKEFTAKLGPYLVDAICQLRLYFESFQTSLQSEPYLAISPIIFYPNTYSIEKS
jgi:hypothetical protein